MSRFDRQATEGGDLPALLGTATEEFRRSLERHVQQVVEAAKGEAAEIERDAQRSAEQKEQQLDLQAQELVQGVITRASSVLDSIELVQTAISGMLAELRAEVKALESGKPGPTSPGRTQVGAGQSSPTVQALAATAPAPKPAQAQAPTAPAQTPGQPPAETARTQAKAPAETARAEEARPAATSQPPPAPRAQQRAPEPAGEKQAPPSPQSDVEKPGPLIEHAPVEPKAQPDRKDSSAEFDQMIHGEIRRMFHSGKAREDVESFLGRFELGDSYAGLLDELYSQKDPSGRRRIFGRRRDR